MGIEVTAALGLRHAIEFAVQHLVVLMGFVLGLAVEASGVRRAMRLPAYARGLPTVLLAVPLLALVVVHVLPLPRLAAGILLLMAISPGVPSVAIAAYRQRGDLSLTVALSLTLSLAAIVLLPLSLRLLSDFVPEVFRAPPTARLLEKVMLPFLVPLVAGWTLRAWRPALARTLLRPLLWLFKAVFICAVLALLVISAPRLREVNGWTLLGMLVMTLGSALLGHLLGGPRPEDRTALALAAVFGNPSIALAVASATDQGLRLLPFMCVYLVLRTLALSPYFLWNKHRLRHGAQPPRRDFMHSGRT
ncbi:Bile acid transporter family protein [Myxococcus hansupus]|uniref:Bile acid transporter family protein n=1 Tax=Pseudomyxococcus hansupus TaxID=1297742 RepID=A0A0H4X5H0_9BACT|nr:bile acid:sodium symporter [Myxococcus hansupus]AKQ63122.1 Bile acid transporter family protein [Myxococcus hansupus]